MQKRPSTVLVTGVSGDLGSRLVPMLRERGHSIIGVDKKSPGDLDLAMFRSMDLGNESSCNDLIELIKTSGSQQVVHLAFVLDPHKTGVLDARRMWQINVGGTARLLEAIAEVNRKLTRVRQLIHTSSVAAYGPRLPRMTPEERPLQGSGLTYAVHKRESDLAVQKRAMMLGDCAAVILRPQIFSGPSVRNYMIDALRGAPSRRGYIGRKLAREGKKLPIVMPIGKKWMARQFQFVHVDDVARVIAWFIEHPNSPGTVEAYNVAARGPALDISAACALTGVQVRPLPGHGAVALALEAAWRLGVSDMPPEALPYVLGEYTLSIEKLRHTIGADFDSVVQYTNQQALAASVRSSPPSASVETGDAERVGRP
jgi:nucleoside-diphosphate-sugar epimerase